MIQPPNFGSQKRPLCISDSKPVHLIKANGIKKSSLFFTDLFLPDAGQPMSDESESGHEEQQHSRAVFGITVDLPGYSDQPKQPGCFQQANERCRLLVQGKGTFRVLMMCLTALDASALTKL
jgi:hypothetical protein